MKKLLFLLALVGMIFTACEGGLDNEENGGNPSTPKIELSQQSVEVAFESAQHSVTVTSPYSWEAISKNDWIVVDTPNGIAGDEKLKFTTLRNEEEQERKGTITLKNTDYNLVAELYVIQKAFVPAITIEPETLTFAVEGGTQEVAVTANFDEYEFSTNADWLTIEKSDKGISVTVPNYVDVDERTAEITISKEKYGVSKVISVTQGAFVPAITIEPESLTFAVEGGTQEVAITANFEYEYSTNADWLTLKRSEKGVNITATLNTEFEERTAEITISNKKYGISKAITITQQCVSAETQIIIYTSSDGNIVKPHSSVFGANIVSNTYKDGQGVIIFDAPVTSIGYEAFYECSSLTSITIPDSVTSIGDYAFSGCTSLISVTIPDSVTSIGEYAFYYCTSLTSVTIGNSVTEIGKMAFYECSGKLIINSNIIGISHSKTENITQSSEHWLYGSKFTDVTIGGKAEQVGKYAFYYYESLANVEIAEGVKAIRSVAFQGCYSLKNITLPNGVTKIWDSAFRECTSLKSIIIPDSVTSIGSWVFFGCSSLTSVTIGNGVTSIGDEAFYNCDSLTSVTIPDSVTSIGEGAFGGCTSLKAFYGKYASSDNRCLIVDGVLNSFAPAGLTEYTIPDSVTSIGEYTFYYCTSLTSIAVPDSVTSIGRSAFYYCTSLTSIAVPDSVTSIGNSAFYDCYSLTSVTIGKGVTSIGGSAFYNCTSELIINSKIVETDYTYNNYPANSINGWLYGAKFTKVTIGNSVTSIGEYTFYYCTSLTSIAVPDSVTSIGDWTFGYCRSLTSVTIPNSVTSIGMYAFDDCASLTSITIPNSVTSIGNSAFRDCTSLTSITIPDSVSSIGEKAFYACTSLKEVYCKPTTPPTGRSDMFIYNASDRKIYVPRNSVEPYKSADGWSDYADYIVGYDF